MKHIKLLLSIGLLLGCQHLVADYTWTFKNTTEQPVMIYLNNKKNLDLILNAQANTSATITNKTQNLADIVTSIKAHTWISGTNGEPVDTTLFGTFPAQDATFIFSGPDANGNFSLAQQR